LHIGIPAGGSVPVDALIAIVGQAGEDISALLNAPAGAPAAPSASAETTSTSEVSSSTPASNPAPVASDSRVKASPLAKSIAKEKGIDLSTIQGSGDNGRIVKKDLRHRPQKQSAFRKLLRRKALKRLPLAKCAKLLRAA